MSSEALEKDIEVAAPAAPDSKPRGLRGLVRETGLYGMGALLGKVLSLALLPVYTRFLTPADYGVMELINLALDVLMIVAGAQLVSGVYRFYHKAQLQEERHAVVSTALVLVGGSFLVAGLAAFLLAPQLSRLIFETPAHATAMRLAAVTVALTPTILVPSAYLRIRGEAGLLVGSGLLKLLLGAAVNVVLLLRGWGVLSIFVGALVSSALIGGTLTLRMWRSVGFHVSARAGKDLIRFGAPLILMNVATFMFTFGDRFFLQAAGGAAVVGLYMMAYQFGFLLIMVGSGPFVQAWQPRRFEIADRADRDQLYSRAFFYSNVLLLSMAGGMVLFTEDFFRIMTTPAFHDAAQYVPVIVLAYVFQAWVSIQDIGVLVKERTGLIALANWVAGAVALAGYALLVPRFLAWGAALTTLLTLALRYLLVYHFSQRLWYVRYDWLAVGRLAALATTLAILGLLLPTLPLAWSLLARSGLFLAYALLLWHSGILKPEDRTRFSAYFNSAAARVGWVR